MSDPILIGVALDDRDEGAIALGIALARITGGRPALVHVYPYEAGWFPSPAYEEVLREESTAGLERLAAGMPEQLGATLHCYPSGSPARGLHAVAEELHPAAIVVGSTHRGRIGHVLPGGVGERLLHGAPCPVAIAPHGYRSEPAELHTIGVAFDGGPESRDALDAAVPLARAGGAELSTYTATEPIETAPATIQAGLGVPPGYGVARREQAERIVEAARELLPADLHGGARLVTGHAAEALAAASRELDLLVCGSRGYGPLHAVLAGGVSMALARTAGCPLLIVPRGAALLEERPAEVAASA